MQENPWLAPDRLAAMRKRGTMLASLMVVPVSLTIIAMGAGIVWALLGSVAAFAAFMVGGVAGTVLEHQRWTGKRRL